jgi:hypothetical protein
MSTSNLFDDASLGGLNDLLDDLSAIDCDDAIERGIVWGLKSHVAAPLALAIERAVEWITDVDAALVSGEPEPAWQPLAEACFAAQSELERSLDDLARLDGDAEDVRLRCEGALARARRAMSVVISAAERRGHTPGPLTRVISSFTEELRQGPPGAELTSGTPLPGLPRLRERNARGTPTLEVQPKASHEYFAFRGVRFERASDPTGDEPSSWVIQDLDDVELR